MPTLDHENQLRAAGHAIVAGVDEAGRGPLAGPVTVAAVVLPSDFTHAVLNDSKQLTEKKREAIYAEITADPRIRWHCCVIEPDEIDRINILQATLLAMRRAVEKLLVNPDEVWVDGNQAPTLPYTTRAIIKGDAQVAAISAASILAKSARDRELVALAKTYPEYAFERHKGYATQLHLAKIREFGACPAHRRSFAPVRHNLADLL